MMESAPALALENVSKCFGRFQAVDRLSLQIEPGHLAGFLGPNGAGKSTTLYMIPRLVRPTDGHIRLFGVDIWKDYKAAIRSVGITVETPAFYEYLSGRQNLELAARLLDDVTARELDEILDALRLDRLDAVDVLEILLVDVSDDPLDLLGGHARVIVYYVDLRGVDSGENVDPHSQQGQNASANHGHDDHGQRDRPPHCKLSNVHIALYVVVARGGGVVDT